MSVRIALTHVIAQRFVRPVRLGTHWLRLRPAPHSAARVTAYSLRVRTEPHFINWTRDACGNHVARLDLPEPVMGLSIDVDVLATLDNASPFDFLVDDDAMEHPYRYEPQLEKELAPYLDVGAPGPRLAAWFGTLDRRPRYVVDRLGELTQEVCASFGHEGAPRGLPDIEAVLARTAGTAGDLAWLLTLGLRSLGIAARFTTGYRVVTGAGTATASLHAWSEAYLPGAGWIGLDPSAGLFATGHHIPLASASDPVGARPVLGFREWCEETADETITARLLESIPASWPYDDAEWTAIRTLGEAVDGQLEAAGVPLAVGREVAFVSPASPAPEWTTAALGPEKLATAHAFARAMRTHVLPGALVQASTAEWYAGDPAPRWRLVCVARADGRPVWRDARLLEAGIATVDAAGALASALARALGVDPFWCLHAHEDPLSRLGRDGADVLVPPAPEDLRNPERRARLADELSERLAGPPIGVVLPLRWDHDAGRWQSGRWRFRRGRLYLVEGTLPMGLRLPLASLPVTGAPPPDVERCGFEVSVELEDFHADANARIRREPPRGRNDASTPRTAVCIEPRNGRLSVFLPPLVMTEHYLSLVASIETAAAATGLGVAVEGYEPPEDARLRTVVIEPDIGALRVALPASVGWAEHAATLETAYALAEAHGLTAERWSADGVREPVGVVAPVVLGTIAPAASPFLDRPELLRALIACWQRHPCLSYLFATRFVGASGAAVRPDEGRADALHELTIALERIPAGAGTVPWLVDRLLRPLLADRTGDMQRAEIRVDRLYDPARASRRLGRVMVRSFDTAPVASMAALESLLAKALVARFARDPRVRPLVRLGAALHDQYLLPTVLWHDLREVLADLRAAGSAFEIGWFEPFRELHFPLIGRAQIGDAALELRPAHEPWPVLAEEATGAGVARFVDSANERLEVRATGLVPGRHVLACNGRRVPLRPTALEGEWVAGVRYKRSNPAATLHPTMPPVGVLVFDLIDAWTGTAIGGCRFVPSQPTILGPVASPIVPDDVRPDGTRPPRVVPAMYPRQQPGAPARFLLGGSGLGQMTPPAAELDVGHLLDLTGCA